MLRRIVAGPGERRAPTSRGRRREANGRRRMDASPRRRAGTRRRRCAPRRRANWSCRDRCRPRWPPMRRRRIARLGDLQQRHRLSAPARSSRSVYVSGEALDEHQRPHLLRGANEVVAHVERLGELGAYAASRSCGQVARQRLDRGARIGVVERFAPGHLAAAGSRPASPCCIRRRSVRRPARTDTLHA